MTSALNFGNPEHLLPPSWRSQVQQWLSEDTPSFDWAGFVVGEEYRDAKLLGKRKGVLAGKPFVDEIFKQLNCTIEWHVKEGESFEPIKHIATVRGAVRYLLLGERVALNVLSRCSGIASMSRWFLDTSRDAGFKGIIAGTRKTTPVHQLGFRLVEKYGMIVGGIDAHRNDLSSMVMLKDNHIWSKGSITNAIQAVRSVAGFSLRLDVEVRDEKEANEAIDAGADVIMLDNLDGEELHLVSKRLKEKWTGKRHFLLETSGGIEAHNLTERLGDNIDILSTSAVHQNVQHIDYSMKISRD
ncbi:nicotinate-nucleotide diphosphorylase [Wallemia mellicola]|uniref:Nicotinate-nucleotide pyrophosphorylase [carboxylating] n=1 Tax=Wallemia mellicola TaxID=1708541 RepID=A0A4T0PK12_9BASI|nr:nicotinate-nucleotide diphosphorylase [Wallemia mellicola]TIC11156.1 nicotinate-nucleotide diphosphorylase [Wallemia mellicola]